VRKKRENYWLGKEKTREYTIFFDDFETNFLLLQNMKSLSIYKGWKKDVWSALV